MIGKKLSKKPLIGSVAVVALAFSISAYSNWWPFSGDKNEESKEQVANGLLTEITWDDFIPDDFVQPENPFATMTEAQVDKLMDGSDESNAEILRLEAEFNYAPVVDSLDGKRVKFPAYITPLEYDNPEFVEEFLLVPYVGACIHTPPPPANQVVHTESSTPIKYPGMYEAVWAIGTIRAKTVKTSLAETGYSLELEEMFPYSAPDAEQ